MIHYCWSIFFLLCVLVSILLYVGGVASIFFMMHFIAKDNWRYLAEKKYGRDWRILAIGGKFALYLLIPAGFAFMLVNIDYYYVNNRWVGYEHADIVRTTIKYFWFFPIGSLLFFIINTISLNREIKLAESSAKATFSQYYKGKGFRRLLIACLFFSLTIYTLQMAKWMGSDNAHREAKCYWVAGQVLNGFRLALTTIIHPEVPLLQPLHELQQVIYDRGTSYLPENDGETGVWQNVWFQYHYSRRDRKPLLIRDHKPSSLMVNLLDHQWFCLETMATKPFADKEMEKEHYYRDYPSLSLSYMLREGWYSGKLIASADILAQMEEHVRRSELLARWLTELGQKWETDPATLKFLKRHPKVEAMRQVVLVFELGDVIQGKIYSREFDCNSSYVKQFVTARKEFAEGSSDKSPAYKRMKSHTQGQRLYRMTIQGGGTRSIKYVLKYFCNRKVAGIEDYSDYESRARVKKITPEQVSEIVARANYSYEIKILEEMFDE